MKKLIFGILGLLQGFVLMAQTEPLPIVNRFNNYRGFNIWEDYPGWTEGNGEGSPTLGESSWFNSTKLFNKAACVQIAETDKRSWLITPYFNATTQSQLSFNSAMTLFNDEPEPAIMGPNDFFKVMVQVGNSNFTELMVFDKDNMLPIQMKSFTISLSQFAGSEIRIGFLAVDGQQVGTYACWHIDDIFITNATAPDVAAEHILLPQWQQCFTESTPIVVRVKNNDLVSVSNVPVRVRIRGAINQNLFNVVQGELAPAQTGELVVGNADLSVEGEYQIVAYTELPNDQLPDNNSSNPLVVKNYGVRDLPLPLMTFTGLYDDNFSTLYPDWFEARGRSYPKVIMNTDWQGDDHPQSRTASVFFSGLGTNDWLVGPIIIPTQHTMISFKAAYEWWMGPTQMGSDDRLAVMVSLDCGLNWTEIGAITQGNNLSTNLTPFFFSLSDYAGQPIRIAIYATSGTISDSESYILHIDDLEVRSIYPKDLAIGQLISPSASCSFTNAEIITIEVKNMGQIAIVNPPIAYSINGEAMVQETINSIIPPGSTMEYSFITTANLSGQPSNQITISILYLDDFMNNNTATFTLKPSSFDLNTMGDFFTSFESGEDLSNWTVVNANNDNHFWQIVDNQTHAYSGSRSFYYESNQSTQTSNDWLFSPCFTLEAGNTYYVQFFYKNRATSFPEKLRFNLASSPNPQSVVNVINDFGEITNSNYLPYTTTFSPPTTGSYYFAWEAYGPADRFGVHIDHVTIRRVFPTDLTITKATVIRKKDQSSCLLLTADSIKVQIANIGINPIQAFTINLTISNHQTSYLTSQDFTNTIPAGGSVEVIFNQNVVISPDIIYDLSLEVVAANDVNSVNNTYQISDYDLNTYYTSFEDDAENSEWTIIDLLGSNSWHVYTGADLARTGLKSFRIRTDQQPTNDWLISGCHYLKAGVCYTLTFYYRSRFSYETLDVTLGPSPTPEAMNTILTIPNFYTNVYLPEQVQISVPVDGTYYIGFHTQQPTTQKYYIHIDDVTLKVSEESMSINPTFEIMDTEVLFYSNGKFVTDYLWQFGDGTTSSEANPSHVYPGPGTYTVTLQATGSCGVQTKSLDVTIESSLDADFIYTVDAALVTFEALTNARSAAWNFGDGNFGYGFNVANEYQFAGTYPVTLTVYDGITSASVTKNVTTTVNQVFDGSVSKLQIYPNPARDYFVVAGDNEGSLLTISDVLGRVIQKVAVNSTHQTIDISTFTPGVYLIHNTKNNTSVKLIKK